MKQFIFKHSSKEEVITIIAVNKESAKHKLDNLVLNPKEWKLQK